MQALAVAEFKSLLVIEDIVGSMTDWPKAVRESIQKPKWKHTDRLAITAFLLGNRLSPLILAEHAVNHKKLSNKTSCDKLMDFIKKHSKGELTHLNYWDLHLSPLRKLKNPSGDCDQDCLYRTNPAFACGKLPYAHWCLPCETPSFAMDDLFLRCQSPGEGAWYCPAGNTYWQEALRCLEAAKTTLPYKS